MEALKLPAKILEVIGKAEPSLSPEKGIAKLVERELIKRISKYTWMIQNFKKKYGCSFEEFEAKIQQAKPDFANEQDYYDWDMAITAIEDLEKEYRKIKDFLGNC
ncbi:MAG TPA: hypothetical protein EYP21_01310 [Syntrophaceae bacterium]|nr:hypothetical protein [Syntrophaceae bacterium]